MSLSLRARSKQVPTSAAEAHTTSQPTTKLVDVDVTSTDEPGVKYKGVSFVKSTGKWTSALTVNGKKQHLGTFDSAKKAADVYAAAKEIAIATKPARKPRYKKGSDAESPVTEADAKDGAAGIDATGDGAGPARKSTGRARTPTTRKVRFSPEGEDLDAMADEGDEFVAISKEEAIKLGLIDENGGIIDLSGAMEEPASSSSSGTPAAGADAGIATSSKYIGVIKDSANPNNQWEAVIVHNGSEISGGEYDDEADAAKAYDALARMYQGPNAKTNFAIDPYKSWIPPEEVVTTGQIETKEGVPLTVEEIVAALKQERGIDVTSLDLKGKADIAEHLVFATGRSTPHMRKMADMVARALRKRRIPGTDAQVEARDMDDWMVGGVLAHAYALCAAELRASVVVDQANARPSHTARVVSMVTFAHLPRSSLPLQLVDCGNIIVNIMDAEAREVFDLENFWSNMKEVGTYLIRWCIRVHARCMQPTACLRLQVR